jgi:hypothetical protein
VVFSSSGDCIFSVAVHANASQRQITGARAALLRALARSAGGGKIRNLICVFSVWRGFFDRSRYVGAHGRTAPP